MLGFIICWCFQPQKPLFAELLAAACSFFWLNHFAPQCGDVAVPAAVLEGRVINEQKHLQTEVEVKDSTFH